jgi:hypothetical protein
LPEGGYGGGHRSTGAQLCFLAELGADPANARVRRGCAHFLDTAFVENGGVSMTDPPTASKVVHCHNAEALRALVLLGIDTDPRVRTALDWQSAAILGTRGFRYYKSGTSGPGFGCAANGGLPCGWGAVKALRMLAALPASLTSARMRAALTCSADFLLSHDRATADYPHVDHISGSWFKFGFPLSYQADILDALLALCEAGFARDRRLRNAVGFVRSKQREDGRWILERTLNGKMWADIEARGKPSKWITLRAFQVLMTAEPPAGIIRA